MRTINKIFATLIIGLLFISCSNLDKTKASPIEEIVPPTLNNMSDVIITDNNKDEEVIFTWSKADFGYNAVISYDMYVVHAEDDPYKLFSGVNETSYAISKDALNLKLAGSKEDGYMGLPEKEKSNISLYLTATIGSNYSVVKSTNNISMNVTTTSAKAPKIVLYIPGNHQGWAPAEAQTILQSEVVGVFKGYIDLNTDGGIDVEHKFTSAPDWNHINYGDKYEALSTDSGAGNLKNKSGFYWGEVNTNTLVAVLNPMVPGVIGEFNGWAADEPMTYTWSSNREEKGYTATIALKAGEGFKIRFNGGWSNNLGANSAEAEPVTIGEEGISTSEGGKNMTVAEDGTYTVRLYFNYIEHEWRISCTKQ